MRSSAAAIVLIISLLALSGCVARTLVSVATAPVRVVSKTVDLATTSQSEADEKRGRAMRHSEQRLGRLDRSYRQNSRRCSDGDEAACTRASAEYAELQRLTPEPYANPD